MSHMTWCRVDKYWAVFGQHLVVSHGQNKPNPSHTDTGLIIQTLVSECPPCGQGHMTSVQCRIRTIVTDIEKSTTLMEKKCTSSLADIYNPVSSDFKYNITAARDKDF